MNNDILIIVPSRSRPNNVKEVIDEWWTNGLGYSDLCIALDDDDSDNYQETLEYYDLNYEGLFVEVNPRIKMLPTLNLVANKYVADYKYIGFMGDDHRLRIPAWEEKLIADFEAGNLIVYGDDLLRGQELPTAAFMDAIVIKALGYMTPPGLIHMYADNFWRDFGRRLDKLCYDPRIVIEHMHFTAGKSPRDELYDSVNNGAVMEHDAKVYEKYMDECMDRDIAKVRAAING